MRRGLRRENGCDFFHAFRRHADPEIERERFREHRAPVFAERHSGDAAHEFIEQESVQPRAVAVRGARLPKWRLLRDGGRDVVVIEDVRDAVERGHAGLMRQRSAEGERAIAVRGEFRPHVRDARVERDPALLHRVQHARNGGAFRRAPHEHGRLSSPRLSAIAIAPACGEGDHFAPVAPHAQRCAEIAEMREVFAEQCFDSGDVHRL